MAYHVRRIARSIARVPINGSWLDQFPNPPTGETMTGTPAPRPPAPASSSGATGGVGSTGAGACRRRLEILSALHRALASGMDPGQTLDTLCAAALRLTGASWALVRIRLDGAAEDGSTVCVAGPDGAAAAAIRAGLLERDPFPDPGLRATSGPIGAGADWPVGLPPAGTILLLPIHAATGPRGWLCCIAEAPDPAAWEEGADLLDGLATLAVRLCESRDPAATRELAAAAERRLETHDAVARILTETSSLDEAAPALLAAICRHLGFAYGILREVDRRDQVMRHATVWHEPDPALAAFAGSGREQSFSPGVGMTGHAWATGRPIWVPDCRTHPVFERQQDVAAAGLRVATAFPVSVGGEIVGVLSFLGREVRPEQPEVMGLLAALGSQIGQFIARRQQEAEIARLNRLYAVLSAVNRLARHAATPALLFEGICRVAVEDGDLALATIATYDPDRGETRFVAGHGEGIETLVSADPLPILETPDQRLDEVSRAIIEERQIVNNDVLASPDIGGPRRRAAVSLGIRAMVITPLLVGGKLHGVLALGSRERDFFTGRYVELLNEVASDITYALDHLANRDRLAYLAHHDPLTGLPNRALFGERLGQALIVAGRRAEEVVLLFIDIRDFRQINDAFGRKAGNDLLCEFARRLRGISQRPEHLARMEGARFATFVAGEGDAITVASRIELAYQQILEEPFVIAGMPAEISGSVGIAVSPADGADVETLLRNAEAAVGNAKRAGRDYLFYEPSLNARVAETLRLQARLRHAAAQEQFDLHYQPKVDARSGRIEGVEALLRWSDPDHGPISPAAFVPLLEQSGLIHPVGSWVMRRALAQQREWMAAGLQPPRVAVNVSALQFQSRQFLATVRELLDEWSDVRQAGGGLDFEITETVVMAEIEDNVAKLAALRAIGVQTAIDDFGTGYSSLAYLSRLPIQSLKIDRSFIAPLAGSPESLTIVSTIISLAHALRLSVIAEGVETEEQACILRRLDCDQIQGYLFHRPMPAGQLARLLEPS